MYTATKRNTDSDIKRSTFSASAKSLQFDTHILANIQAKDSKRIS